MGMRMCENYNVDQDSSGVSLLKRTCTITIEFSLVGRVPGVCYPSLVLVDSVGTHAGDFALREW
jgi:hypothetical protein